MPAIIMSQMKYGVLYGAYAIFDKPFYKESYPDVYNFFTNQP